MVSSMTGYGRAEEEFPERTVTVELKSVNHRFLEFSSKTPRGMGGLDEMLKSLVSQKVSRGKVEAYVNIASKGTNAQVSADVALAGSYLQALRTIGDELGVVGDVELSDLIRFPDIFIIEKEKPDEETISNQVMQVASKALDRLVDMRQTEGERLCLDLNSRLRSIFELKEKIEALSPLTVEKYRERLYNKLSQVLSDRSIDESRILTEAAIFADRIAVDEETVRIQSHIDHFGEVLAKGGQVGRKLDFLTQELNREANTIGSKVQDATLSAIVIELKSEIEKVREQIQNLE